MTYKEVIYIILDEIKGTSDDFIFNEDHILFLIDKYRAFLLKQRYSDIRKQIPESNYQTICLDLIEVPAISGEPCEGGSYLRSKDKIPFLMPLGITRVYPIDYYQGEISFINRDRMRYVGYNKYLNNIIYCSIAPDNYLYFKSNNPQFLYLEKVRMVGIFSDSVKASSIHCDDEDKECDPLDRLFPLEDSLLPNLTELVVKELTNSIYRPDDESNNAKDDLANTNVSNG